MNITIIYITKSTSGKKKHLNKTTEWYNRLRVIRLGWAKIKRVAAEWNDRNRSTDTHSFFFTNSYMDFTIFFFFHIHFFKNLLKVMDLLFKAFCNSIPWCLSKTISSLLKIKKYLPMKITFKTYTSTDMQNMGKIIYTRATLYIWIYENISMKQ